MQFLDRKVAPGEIGEVDDAGAHHFERFAVDRHLEDLEVIDEAVDALVQQHHGGDDKERVEQRHVGIEGGIAHGRTQCDHEQEFDSRKLGNGAAADPAQQEQRVEIDDDGADDDLKIEEGRVLAEEHADEVEGDRLFLFQSRLLAVSLSQA